MDDSAYGDEELARPSEELTVLQEQLDAVKDSAGKIQVSQLPEIFEAYGGTPIDFDRIHDSLMECCPAQENPDEVTVEEAVTAYRYIVQQRTLKDYTMRSSTDTDRPALSLRGCCGGLLGCCKRLRQRFSRSAVQTETHVYSSMKPTTRLLILVVIIAFVVSLAVCGTALGLNSMSLMSSQQDSLQRAVKLVLNAVESFTVTIARKNTESNQQVSGMLLSTMVQQLGYNLNMKTVIETMLNDAEVGQIMLDNAFDLLHKRQMMSAATVVASMLNQLCVLGQSSLVVPVVNGMNGVGGGLLEGQEVVLGQRAGSGGSGSGSGSSSSSSSISILSTLRFSSTDCSGGSSSSGVTCVEYTATTASVVGLATALGTNHSSGSFTGTDYAGQAVYGGYAYVGCADMGVVVTTRRAVLSANYLRDTVHSIDELNAAFTGTTEIMIQQKENPGYPLSVLKMPDQCPHACGRDDAGRLAVLGANTPGGNPTAIALDYRQTVPIIAVAVPLSSMNGSLLYEIDVSEIRNNLIRTIVTLDLSAHHGSMELLLAEQAVGVNNTATYAYLTQPKYMANCSSLPCLAGSNGTVVDEALYAATVSCANGVGTMRDYRGVTVLAAYFCFPEIHLGMSFKIDDSEIAASSVEEVVNYANQQNSLDTSSMKLLVSEYSHGSVVILNNEEDATCPCTTSFSPAVRAASGSGGLAEGSDYRGVSVLSAYTYSSALDLGLTLKMDMSEVQRPLMLSIGILVGTALGIALLGVTFLWFCAKRMLRSIEESWEKGKKAVEEESARFQTLVSALYPKCASVRLLAGELHIVLELQAVTIIFTDIVGFSTTSNRLTADELLQWIGYTFGVMDTIAEYYKIYKVKNIGDAFFGISGIPDLVPEGDKDEHTLRMVRFAVNCIQVFSGRYLHPDAGACLEVIAKKSTITAKPKGKGNRNQSMSDSMSTRSVGGKSHSQCKMRYGIARGPATAGILQGKCPTFDVYGKSVNLASRMESTGHAGHVQCSESAFAAMRDCSAKASFAWKKPHTTYAKGFGNVQAYYVHSCKENPPYELLTMLSLNAFMGEFVFEKYIPLTGYAPSGGGGGIPAVPSISNNNNTSELPFVPEARSQISESSPRTILQDPNYTSLGTKGVNGSFVVEDVTEMQ